MANNIPLSGAADKRKGVDILQPTFRIDGSLILVSLSLTENHLYILQSLFTVRQLKAHFLCLAYSTLKLTTLFLSEYMRTMINQLSLVKYDINIIYISR